MLINRERTMRYYSNMYILQFVNEFRRFVFSLIGKLSMVFYFCKRYGKLVDINL